MEGSPWKITLRFLDAPEPGTGDGAFRASVALPASTYPNAELVWTVLGEEMRSMWDELGWRTCASYAGHEAVTSDTRFEDLTYQRGADWSLVIDVFERSQATRTIKVPTVYYPTCAVCHEPNDREHALRCMHFCCCARCWPTVLRCPVCAKRVAGTGMPFVKRRRVLLATTTTTHLRRTMEETEEEKRWALVSE